MSNRGAVHVASVASFRDLHPGRPAFIIGPGESIGEQDLAPLRRHVAFAVEGVARRFRDWGFEPTYHVMMDAGLARRQPDLLNLPRIATKFATADVDCARHNAVALRSLGTMGFSFDPERGVYDGGTTLFAAIQLACYMGCDPVYLIGCDMTRPRRSAAAGTDRTRFSREFLCDSPDLLCQAESFALAGRVFEREDRRLYNATLGGHLEALPRVRYEEVLRHPSRPPETLRSGPRPPYLPLPPGPAAIEQFAAVQPWLFDADWEGWAQLQLPLICFQLGDEAGGWTALGDYACKQGDLTRAERYYRAALAANPRQPMVAYQLGMIARARDDEEEARTCFEAELSRFGIDQRGDDAEWLQCALTHRALGDLDAAIGSLAALAEAFPCARALRMQLAETLMEADRHAEAVPHLEYVVGRDRLDGRAWLRLGRAYRETGDARGALRAFERAIGADPPLPEAEYEYGVVLREVRRGSRRPRPQPIALIGSR